MPERGYALIDMDNSDYLGNNRHDERLGVNKIGKNIRKSPQNQPNFGNLARQPPHPQVYNINKNDFRSVVQQLTGSPSHHSQEPLNPRHPYNSPKPPSMRLHTIRPPRLAPINVYRPQMPPRGAVPNLARPAPYHQHPPQAMVPSPMTSGDQNQMGLLNPVESPISAYMRYLQHSIMDPSYQGHPQPQPQPQPHPQYDQRPRFQAQMSGPPLPLPSPRMINSLIPPSPTPTSPFVMPSPSYFNLLSPLSPYPLLSPGYLQTPPLTPVFPFSPLPQSGILGPRTLPPPSPGMGFPSPGFFQIPSPRWRDY